VTLITDKELPWLFILPYNRESLSPSWRSWGFYYVGARQRGLASAGLIFRLM